MPSSKNRNALIAVVTTVIVFTVGACSSQPDDVASPVDSGSVTAAPSASNSDNAERARLHQLWVQRTTEKTSSDFDLGPGDVLQVSVPAVEELKDRSVRVSGDDTIALPLVGVLNVRGKTEQGVREDIKKRLDKYMYDPQVDVFTKEYQSRQVAVVGMVQKPGLYTLSSPTDTVLSMISRAGGTTADAAQHILLVPAASGDGAGNTALLAAASQMGAAPAVSAPPAPTAPISSAAARPQQANAGIAAHPEGESVPASYNPGSTGVPAAMANVDPILIDLSNPQGQNELNVPARPGDVIIVPAAGEVMVKGWVQNAGAFKITPGMTVLGAVTAAGGQMFSSTGVILRSSPNGGKVDIPIDLSQIEKGSAPDVPVQAGDVVIIDRSVTGAVPYAFYTVFSKFGTGLYPAIPFF